MLIKHRKASDVKSSEITPKSVYINRRKFLTAAGFAGVGAGLAAALPNISWAAGKPMKGKPHPKYNAKVLGEKLTDYEAVTSYNNFYEFGVGKRDPSQFAHTMKTKPWTVKVEGACEKPGTYSYEDLIRSDEIEDRVYRFRCVEAWSMIIPWLGVPMHKVLSRFGPTSKAKYVYFETLADPEQMPGLRRPVLQRPYREGLRIDEAMNPLALFAVGVYGEEMPNQNGAPIRSIVPWKYGFKSIKSIVLIRFQENEPKTSWHLSAPHEYGFYSNVNPNVSHPRWSQRSERRIGDGGSIFGFPRRIGTKMFNGYEEEVAGLYKGLDLAKFR